MYVEIQQQGAWGQITEYKANWHRVQETFLPSPGIIHDRPAASQRTPITQEEAQSTRDTLLEPIPSRLGHRP